MRPPETSATPKRSASVTSLSRICAPCAWLTKPVGGLPDIAFDDVVAEHYADLLAVGEMFGQVESVRDAAFAFLVGVVNVLEAELLAVRRGGAESHRNSGRP